MISAVITGITGQDGSYLAELLLSKGYEVHGIVRRSSIYNRRRLEHLREDSSIYGKQLFLHYADLRDTTLIRRILTKLKPDELYHLAGQSHVGLSFDMPESTCEETATATLALLEICRDLESPPKIVHASSSEIFGEPVLIPQNESTPYMPTNPYGCAKTFATNLCNVYRESFGLFISNSIAFNHESPRRSENFVTRKITSTAARIANGADEILELGNLDGQRDWGYAPEYVESMWAMLQQSSAEDYVLATGVLTSVREFAQAAFAALGIDIVFEGENHLEQGRDRVSGKMLIRVNPIHYRPADHRQLVGDATKAREQLGFSPTIHGVTLAEVMANAEDTAVKLAAVGSC